MLNQNNLSKTATQEVTLPGGLPRDIWIEIVTYLSPKDLENFKLACKDFMAIGQADKVLKPIYNQLYARLRKLDPSLPQTHSATDYKQQYYSYFDNVSNKIKSEVTYLREHHLSLIKKYVDNQPSFFEKMTSIFNKKNVNNNSIKRSLPLKSLERLSSALDDLNIEIIKPFIKINSSKLIIYEIKITRIPQSLMLDTNYLSFWKALKVLNCRGNHLTWLKITELNSIELLDCSKNELFELNLEGLNALTHVNCEDNELTVLNLDGVTNLIFLYCTNNELTTLPAQVVAKFGQEWATKALALQKARKPVTPLYQHLQSQNRNSSQIEEEKEPGNQNKPKLN